MLKAQEFGSEQVTINFRFAITDRSKAKMMQSRITFDTRLKNPLMQDFLFFFPLCLWPIIPSRLSLSCPFYPLLRFKTYKHDNKHTHKESNGKQKMPQVMPVEKSKNDTFSVFVTRVFWRRCFVCGG